MKKRVGNASQSTIKAERWNDCVLNRVYYEAKLIK